LPAAQPQFHYPSTTINRKKQPLEENQTSPPRFLKNFRAKIPTVHRPQNTLVEAVGGNSNFPVPPRFLKKILAKISIVHRPQNTNSLKPLEENQTSQFLPYS